MPVLIEDITMPQVQELLCCEKANLALHTPAGGEATRLQHLGHLATIVEIRGFAAVEDVDTWQRLNRLRGERRPVAVTAPGLPETKAMVAVIAECRLGQETRDHGAVPYYVRLEETSAGGGPAGAPQLVAAPPELAVDLPTVPEEDLGFADLTGAADAIAGSVEGLEELVNDVATNVDIAEELKRWVPRLQGINQELRT